MKLCSDRINACLPQTQCEECGYKGCKPYAEAIAQGEATIDLCPPGGVRVVNQLAKLLDVDPAPYLAQAEQQYRAPSIASIEESLCIGCVKCIKACPVDAIVGSAKLMHTVVPDLCTGCGLCVEPCPMDCITMQPANERDDATLTQLATQWQTQYEARIQRHVKKAQRAQTRHEHAKLKQTHDTKAAKKAAIADAIARVNARRQHESNET